MTSAFHSDGAYEIPGLDHRWETKVKHVDDDDLDPLSLPVADGNTFPFEAMLFLEGSAAATCTVTVSAPSNSNGGFVISGLDDTDTWVVNAYSADGFGDAQGPYRAGISGTLTSYLPLHIEGWVGAGAPGQVRITVSGATVKQGSILRPVRIGDSRGYA